jgi:hypothetical protein
MITAATAKIFFFKMNEKFLVTASGNKNRNEEVLTRPPSLRLRRMKGYIHLMLFTRKLECCFN